MKSISRPLRLAGLSRPGLIYQRPRYQLLFANTKYLNSNRFNSTIAAASLNDPAAKSDKPVVEEETEETTGTIVTQAREGLLYYDNAYPLKLWRFKMTPINYLLGLTDERVTKIIQDHSIPPGLGVKLTKIIPREKDGGAFACYVIEDDSLTVKDTEATIAKHLADNPYRPIFNPFVRLTAFPVKGQPWIEDLRRRHNNIVKVVFEGEDLSQELVYQTLRRYGSIIDIIPPSPSSKELPRFATVIFSSIRSAVTARNCVNGLVVEGTKIHVSYVPPVSQHALWQWLVDHSRITIPAVLALLATVAVLIFEPIRTWFIKKKVCGTPLLETLFGVSWIRDVFTKFLSTARGYFKFYSDRDVVDLGHLWEERRQSVHTLTQWIEENVGTFIIVQGPRGSGKQDLVLRHALKDRHNVLTIDCEALSKPRADAAFVKASSAQLGYYPVFPWMNSITTFLDLVVQGLTGQKTGFSESNETQFKNMLNTAANALHEIALEKRHKLEKINGGAEMSDEDFLQAHPEAKPVVVINKFLHRSEGNQFIYPHLAEWCSMLVQSNAAHVIFITNDVSYDKILSPALPNQIFKILTVGDANTQSARSFVLQQVSQSEVDLNVADGEEEKLKAANHHLDGLDEALRPLGGRMTDLQAFVRRLKSGETPQGALKDMIDQSSMEIVQMFLLRQSAEWTREQAWILIKLLANGEESQILKAQRDPSESTKHYEIPITTLVQDPNFKTYEQQQALVALEHNEMIATRTAGARPVGIRAGKPLYLAAFKAIYQDKSLASLLELQLLEKLVAGENSKITKIEDEMKSLSEVPSKWEVKARLDYLATKLYASQSNIDKYEKSMAIHKKLLTTAQ